MGALVSLIRPSRQPVDVLRVIVVGESGAGKTYFLDAFDPAREPAMTRLPTNGFEDVDFKHGQQPFHLKEVGGRTHNAMHHVQRLLPAHHALYYVVDLTQPLEQMYAVKQQFLGMMASVPIGMPVCLVFNTPPRNGRGPLSRRQAKRLFQVKALRSNKDRRLATLYLTYQSVQPVEQMLSWTEEITRPPQNNV